MLMVCIMCTRECVCFIYNTYGVGYGVAVCNERQYQSLDEWNGKIAAPLFLYAYSVFKYT